MHNKSKSTIKAIIIKVFIVTTTAPQFLLILSKALVLSKNKNKNKIAYISRFPCYSNFTIIYKRQKSSLRVFFTIINVCNSNSAITKYKENKIIKMDNFLKI